MTELGTLIAALDVAVVDPDLLWRVAHMNLLRSVIVRDFAAPEEALEELRVGRPAVLVLGPAAPADHVAQVAAARRARSELRVLRILPGPATDPTGDDHDDGTAHPSPAPVRNEPPFDATLLDDGDEAGYRDAVAALLVGTRVSEEPPPTTGPDAEGDAGPGATGPGASTSASARVERDAGPPPVVLGTAPADGEAGEAAAFAPTPLAPHHLRPAPGLALPPRLAVVTSAKGGEGASTVAVNLAHELASRAGVRTAIVDGEPFFGDVTMDLGSVPARAPVVTQRPVAEAMLEQLVTWPSGTEPIVVRTPVLRGDAESQGSEVLRELLSVAGQIADVVVADVPLELLLAAPWRHEIPIVVLVSSSRTASLKNALVAAQRLSGSAEVGLVINELGPRQHRSSPAVMAKNVGLPLLGHLPHSGALRRAAAKPRPRAVAAAHTHYAHAMTGVRRAVARHFPVLV